MELPMPLIERALQSMARKYSGIDFTLEICRCRRIPCDYEMTLSYADAQVNVRFTPGELNNTVERWQTSFIEPMVDAWQARYLESV